VEIKGISNNSFFINPVKNKKGEQNTAPVQKDKLEISAQAMEKVAGGNLDQNRVNEINSKISSGFYNSDAVLNKVADKLLTEFGK